MGVERKLSVAAVDQHREAPRTRPAEIVERIESGADGATGVEHVVDEHDSLAVNSSDWDARRARGAGRLPGEVVAVHGHVEGAGRDGAWLERLEDRADP